MDSLRRLNCVISICGIVSFFASVHVGSGSIQQPIEAAFPLMLLIAVLSIIALLGAIGRTREESEMPRYERQTKMVVYSAVATLLLDVLVLIGLLPPGMDLRVPFMFVIPPLVLPMILVLPVEVIWGMEEAYIDRVADRVIRRLEERQSE